MDARGQEIFLVTAIAIFNTGNHQMLSAHSIKGAIDSGRRFFLQGFTATALAFGLGIGAAQADQAVNALPGGVAMDGFDVVAYFDGAPAQGSSAHGVEYKGKTWLFSSAENASAFAANPVAYEPQHNGWCSYAGSEGYGAEVDFVDD